MLIRHATTRDATAIARIQVRCWQTDYRGIVPDAYLAGMTVEQFTNRWLGNLAEMQRLETAVAEDEEETIVGWAGFGLNQSGLGQDTGELAGLYVDPDCWNRGIGSILLGRAEKGLAAAGYERAILWTLEANERTRRFYEKHGWSFDGVSEIHPSGAVVVQYKRDLTSVDLAGASE